MFFILMVDQLLFQITFQERNGFIYFKDAIPKETMRKSMSLGHERSIVNIELIKGWYDGVFNYLKIEVPKCESSNKKS